MTARERADRAVDEWISGIQRPSELPSYDSVSALRGIVTRAIQAAEREAAEAARGF